MVHKCWAIKGDINIMHYIYIHTYTHTHLHTYKYLSDSKKIV